MAAKKATKTNKTARKGKSTKSTTPNKRKTPTTHKSKTDLSYGLGEFLVRPQQVEQIPFTRNQLISTLTKIGHGDLSLYVQPGLLAGKYEPELLAHFISWQRTHGKVRDGKVALPILALANVGKQDREFIENAVAHLCTLTPRDLIRAWKFHSELVGKGVGFSGGTHKDVREGIHKYLQFREAQPNYWERQVIQHRGPMKELYNLLKRQYGLGAAAKRVLFEGDGSNSSLLSAVTGLNKLSALEAAGVILKYKLPFEVIVGAASGASWKVNSPDIILALIEGMTGNQIVTNTKMLERMGVMKDPALKAAYNNALDRARKDQKMDALKAGRAAQAVVDSGKPESETVSKLKSLQNEKVSQLKGIEGDWLVMGDKSGSMSKGIEIAKMVAGFLASVVKGKVYLVFFDTEPYNYDVTGKTYDQITEMTKHIKANGGTFCGVPIDYLMDKGIVVNGIAVVSDGGDYGDMGPGHVQGRYTAGGPSFVSAYKKYCTKFGIEPTVYMYQTVGEPNRMLSQCQQHGIPVQLFETTETTDYYSVVGMAETMRTSRYGLVDEIMETPLLTYKEVFTIPGERDGVSTVVRGSWEDFEA